MYTYHFYLQSLQEWRQMLLADFSGKETFVKHFHHQGVWNKLALRMLKQQSSIFGSRQTSTVC